MPAGSPSRLAAAALVVLSAFTAQPAAAGPGAAAWLDVLRSEALMDLEGARQAALAAVREGSPADAAAAAGWWLENLEVLHDPGEILLAGAGREEPEVRWILARVEARPDGAVPRGVLSPVELAGPFGVLDRLDLERDVVPPDGELPPVGTGWSLPWRPFRLVLRPRMGAAAPPRALLASGVYLAAWTVETGPVPEGWLVVEAEGGFNLEVDGTAVDRRRDCGGLGAGIHWYRVRLEAGLHRIRIAMASGDLPRVRVSLLDAAGRPLSPVLRPGLPVPSPAPSSVQWALPPVEAAFGEPGEDRPLATLLAGAALAGLRNDPVRARLWFQAATRAFPDDPLSHLAMASFYLTRPTGAAAEVDLRRSRAELGKAGELPEALLVHWILARRQQRREDAERFLDELVERYPRDVRVLRMWVGEAVRRGWPREAEESLQRLEALLPGTPWVLRLRLAVLKALDRWEERAEALRALVAADPLGEGTVELALEACRPDLAIRVLEARRRVEDDPALDLTLARVLLESGDVEGARALLAAVRDRWGDLDAADDLRVTLAAEAGPGPQREAVEAALARNPSRLDLRTLWWRLGGEPFYRRFQVDALEVARSQGAPPAGVDSELILDQAVERVFPDGSSLYYYHGLTRAVTPAGVEQAATVQLLPDTELLAVRVIKADGTVLVPPEASSGAPGFRIAGVSPGDMVESEYVSAVAPTGASRRGHLSPYVYRFADVGRSFGLSEYALLVPRDIPVVVDGNLEGLEVTESEEGGLLLTRWRAEKMPPLQPEPFSPPQRELFPWVSYGFGVTWQDVGDTVRDRFLAVLRGSPELWEWSEPILEQEPPEKALRDLVERLVDEVEAGQGLLDLGTTAGESFSLKEGNRLAVLMAVLVHAGWDVDVVLARPLPDAGTHLKVPTFDAFSFPVLRVRNDGSEIWVDLEEEVAGVGHLRPLLQRTDALVLPLAEPRRPVTYLERTPEFPNPDLEERLHLKARILPSGDAEVAYDLMIRGAQGLRLLDMIEGVPGDRAAVVYQQIASSLFPGAARVSGSVEQKGASVVLHLDLHLPGACVPEDGALVCRSLVVARPLSPRLASLPERRYPLVLQLPVLQHLEMELAPPPGWRLQGTPRNLNTPWGSVSETISGSEGWITSTLRLKIHAQVVEPGDYPRFVRFCHALDELLLRPPRLVPGGGSP